MKQSIMQEFEQIKGYEGLYLINRAGVVVSLPRRGTSAGEKIIKHFKDKKGYETIYLTKDSATKGFKLHRLLAIQFIPNPKKLPQINHKDGNKLNNSLDNLEWCTNRENYEHSVKHGLFSKEFIARIGVGNKRKVERSDGEIFDSIREASRATGRSETCIAETCKGRQKTTAGYKFKFLEE